MEWNITMPEKLRYWGMMGFSKFRDFETRVEAQERADWYKTNAERKYDIFHYRIVEIRKKSGIWFRLYGHLEITNDARKHTRRFYGQY